MRPSPRPLFAGVRARADSGRLHRPLRNLLNLPIPRLDPAIPGRIDISLENRLSAQVYSQLLNLGLAKGFPNRDIMRGAAQAMTQQLTRFNLRRLPLSFVLSALKEVEIDSGEGAADAAIAVRVSEPALIELEEPVLRMEKRWPGLGKYIWGVIHHGAAVLGNVMTPGNLMHLASAFYWDGETDERATLARLEKEGENIERIEMVKKADLTAAFPKWVLDPWGEPKREPAALKNLPFAASVRQLARIPRTFIPQVLPATEGIPMFHVPWDSNLMSRMSDEHYEMLNNSYEDAQGFHVFESKSPESFQKAWAEFRHYLEVVQWLEDIFDGLLGPKEAAPVTVEAGPEETTTLAATHAVLLYSGGRAGVVTTHEIARAPGRYVILPGKPTSAAVLYSLLTQLNPTVASKGILPPGLLRHNPNELMWHLPSQMAPIHFQTQDPRLNAMSGQNVRHPHLLFHARGRRLRVAALASGDRPTEPSPLFRAPYYNLSAAGNVCVGTMAVPKRCHPEAIREWERAFFRSAFTHANGGAFNITSHSEGHAGLWLEQESSPPEVFPNHHLVPLNCQLKDWLNEGAQEF